MGKFSDSIHHTVWQGERDRPTRQWMMFADGPQWRRSTLASAPILWQLASISYGTVQPGSFSELGKKQRPAFSKVHSRTAPIICVDLQMLSFTSFFFYLYSVFHFWHAGASPVDEQHDPLECRALSINDIKFLSNLAVLHVETDSLPVRR